jgi:hypothetical protein
MARQTLGDFHINLQSPLSHIQQSQFQQGIVQEIIQQFGPSQIVLFELLGEIGMPKWRVLAIKQSIKELWHLHHLPARIYGIFGWKKISFFLFQRNLRTLRKHNKKLGN